MDMEKIMAYVEKIAENLEGLVCAIGCDSMPSDGAIYVDGEQKVNYISTREALRILDGFGNNSASVMIGKSDYILIYDASRKLVIDGPPSSSCRWTASSRGGTKYAFRAAAQRFPQQAVRLRLRALLQ